MLELLIALDELLASEDSEDELGNTGKTEEADELGRSDELPTEEAGNDEAADALLAGTELETLASLAVTTLTLDAVALDTCDRSEDEATCNREEACWPAVFLPPPLPPPQAVKVVTKARENNRRTKG